VPRKPTGKRLQSFNFLAGSAHVRFVAELPAEPRQDLHQFGPLRKLNAFD
jgi:hypothetical protein